MNTTFTVKTPLWEHQEKLASFAVDKIKQFGYAWWIADCGVGKTLASLKVIELIRAKKVLVLTTKAAISSAWEIDIATHTKGGICVPLVKGSSKDKSKLMLQEIKRDGVVIVIVNYETSWRLPLKKVKWDFVIADESHKLQSYNSRQSTDLAKMLADVPAKLAMTGTAWSNSPLQVFGQVRFLAPKFEYKKRIPSSKILGAYSDFFDRYAVYYILNDIKIPTSYKNQEELKQKIKPYTIRVKKEDVLELPKLLFINRYGKLAGKHKKQYEVLDKEFCLAIENKTMSAPNALVHALRLQMFVSGIFKPDKEQEMQVVEGASTKISILLDIVDEIGKQPFVVFTRFKEEVILVKKALEKRGLVVLQLTGDIHQHNEFQKSEGDCIIANLQAGSTGVNLSRASYAIYYSLGVSRIHYEQSLSRLHRPGVDLTKPVTLFFILIKNTIDEKIMRALKSKERVSDYLLKGL